MAAMDDSVSQLPKVGRIHGQNIIIRQSWWNQLTLLAGVIVLTIGVGWLTIEYPEYSLFPFEIKGKTYGFAGLFLVPLILLLKAVFLVYNERFVLAPEYLIHVTGRLTWRERSVRLEYARIQEIEIGETIFQRVLRLGDVRIVPIAGATTSAFDMTGVRQPRLVKDAIRIRQKGETVP